MKPSAQFYTLLPELKNRFIGKEESTFSIQIWFKNYDGSFKKKEPDFIDQKRKILDTDFVNHFFNAPLHYPGRIEGSLALNPVTKDRKVKFCVIDADSLEQKNIIVNQIIPIFKKYQIDYIYEFGGDNNDRCHIWFLCDFIDLELLNKFVLQILEEANTNTQELDEIYPTTREKNVIRLWGGPHLKRNNKRYPIEYHGEIFSDPVDMCQVFTSARPFTEEEINKYLVEKPTELVQYKSKKPNKFYYRALNFPLPMENLPLLLKTISKNCQALYRSLEEIKNQKGEEQGLDKRRGTTHMLGLFLHGMAKYNDIKLDRTDGEEWINYLLEEYRFRDSTSHNWDSKIKDLERIFPSCKAWDTYIGKCEGCPFKDKIFSPKQFYYGIPIKRNIIKEINLTTPDWVRANTFKNVEKRIHESLRRKEEINIRIKSFQQAGKSFWICNTTALLAKQGKNILIAVPTAKLALEFRDFLKDFGTEAFILMSHENIFGHQANPPKEVSLSNFDCPKYHEIQYRAELGVSSGSYKKEFCMKCPLLEKCYYPTQYSNVLSEEHKVVIIQHAHLSCQEVIFELMKKNFDVLFIDESFYRNCYRAIKPLAIELEILKNFNVKWIERLYKWLLGDEGARGKLSPDFDSLKKLNSTFKALELPWTIPDYVRFYNQGRIVNKITGIEVIYELANIPVKIFTDATTPMKILQKITGMVDFEVYGEGEILDYTKIHPKNRIVQILDKSISNLSLQEEDRFYKLLSEIGYLMEKVFPNKRALITVYKKYKKLVENYYKEHSDIYPTVLERIHINNMEKGTNAYIDFDIQFLLAGIYFNAKDYYQEVYKLKTIENYYRRKYGLEEIQNIYPYEITESSKIEWIEEGLPVTRIEAINGKGYLVEYPAFRYYPPSNIDQYLIYELNVGESQQADRVRFTPEKPRIKFIFHNFPLPSTYITDSILENEFLDFSIKNFSDLFTGDLK